MISEAFGNKFVGVYDKKLYVWADDGGEQVQIAISLTCPKNTIGVTTTPMEDYDFTKPATEPESVSLEIEEDERKNIETLMQKLGL